MLRRRAIVEGEMGAVLASYLVEHLPFEAEPEHQIETVRLVLQPGLLDDEAVDGLWRRAQRKPAYYVGFLAARADDLPLQRSAHPAHADIEAAIAGSRAAGEPLANLLLRILSVSGQGFIDTVLKVFDKPSNQDVVNISLDIVADYFAAARPEGPIDATFEALQQEADDWLGQSTEAALLMAIDGVDASQLRALRILSGLSYGVVRPVFGDSTAIGSLMRRKIQPVVVPMLEELGHLRAPQR
jgi:hypothetical protein